ncbi:MAG: penicillin-binding protein, partial [Candidatus Dadabacteria bacterium]|nr:penicillin-binding protein [Candidatus Dadabacteria bacterium]NIQ13002.1 penicillin-binding protein [Candidatus Dadabacteria bacterium]
MSFFNKVNLFNKNNSVVNFLSLCLLSLVVVCLFIFLATYFYFSIGLPDLKDLTGYKPHLINEIYSSDGTLIAEYGVEKRKLIDLEEIPDHVINAFIAIEDKRFYDHSGLDIQGIIRALIQNISEGQVVSGGSTITQQVTKNLILTPERTYTRKIKEAILSYRIEKNLTKNEILYLYLNHIYLADGTYGVEAASKNYFGKSVRNVNIAEAALLAGIPKRPERYSPRRNFQNSKQRQITVLKIMEEEKFITAKQKKAAEDFKIIIKPKNNIESHISPYFAEFVRKYLENKVGTEEYK